jgi:large subunit ribosomal protein L25
LNENIRIQDINVPNIEVMNPPRIPVASIVMTRQLKQEESEAAKAGKK